MIDTLSVIALPKFLSHKSNHHALDPLFPNDRILCLLQSSVVVVVNSVEACRNGGLLRLEKLRLGCGRHDEKVDTHGRMLEVSIGNV